MEYAMANARAMALYMVEDLSANTSTKMVEDLSINTSTKIVGTVVLMKKNILDMNDLKASLVDRVHELLGKRVYLQLISATCTDSANWEYGAKLGMPAYLEKWVPTPTPLIQRETKFTVTFEWDVETMGVPGAFIIRNYHHNEFYLKELTLEYVPGHGRVHFDCNSWVYPAHRYDYDRIFFSNKAYLPSQTPEPLRKYREQELVNLRGYGRKGELKKWDRVYDYAYYNDLGLPERGRDYARPVLGGSEQYPYPRRGKTGRKPNRKDPETESRLYALDMEIYVPRDERFSTVKFGDFVAYALKSFNQVVVGAAASLRDHRKEFESFQDIHDLYEGRISLPDNDTLKKIRNCFPSQIVKELLRNDGEKFLKFPMPAVIKENKSAWDTDEEFARETLAGPNPVIIKRLQAFPPTSGLDPEAYGDHASTIKREDIENKLEGLTVGQAIDGNKLFILDHHDALMPYLRRINTTSAKIYATRTLFFLQEDGTLKPLAIELSLPHPQGDKYGVISKVFTPAQRGINGSIWRLAKAYVAVNDSGVHQLISHWLNTHAVIEPFVIASHRQLSVVHPIHKLLHPHFRDTMNINAQARKNLINAGGVLELTVFPEKYALEMSSAIYKSWNFNDQALPVDLVKRGVAIRKSDNNSDDIELLIKDYPYAVDGLEIWSAIKTWVTEYCSFYYPSDEEVQDDEEIQSWWEEIRNEGHGDLKDKTWWIEMNTKENLIQACTIIIWIASAFHAAVNFGQYSYAGFLPNRPTVSRRFMPEQGTPEYAELTRDPDTVFLKTITSQFETLLGISLIEILSRHSAEELYLGQRETLEWTRDDGPLAAFERFRTKLVEIEKNVTARNSDGSLKNRNGPVKMPYTLLYPNTSDFTKEGGLTGKGIPNSVSI